MMKRIIASAVLTAALLAGALPALAKQFIQDNAQMFSATTVDKLNTRISNFNRDTGKEIVVVTVPSVSGTDVRTAAENTFAQQSVNGVLIFIDKGDRRDYVIPDRAAVQAGWWNPQTSSSIIAAMGRQFRGGDFDGGITTAVNSVFDIYRSHVKSQRAPQSASRTYAQQTQTGGVHIGVFWWIIIALFAFFIIRSLIRASRGGYYGGGYGGGPGGPGYGPGGPGYGPGYGGPGYGGGWGYGGGGGFWSGLLGGLGGAWLGNELFGQHNYGGMQGGVDPNAMQQPTDGGGWQADPGQADMSGGAGGDWGGGGWGDIGGGGGDMGGGFGGGDAGGGW